MVDRSIVGLSGPEFEVPLERGKIREFAASIGAYLPEYLEDPHPVVPPTFLLTSAYFWGYLLERPGDTVLARIGADKMMSLDGGQSFTFHGDLPRAGTRLIARTFVEDVWEKQGRSGGRLRFFKMCSRFRDQDGRTVAEWRPVSVVPEVAPEAAIAQAQSMAPPGFMGRDEQRDEMTAITRRTARDLVLGEGPGPITMPGLTLSDVVRYQFASGEDGPAHHDALAAQAEGFPTYFSVGMLHAGLLASYAVTWLGPAHVRHFESRIEDMIWPGDVLTYEGRITALEPGEDSFCAEVELLCRRGAAAVTRAKARFELPLS